MQKKTVCFKLDSDIHEQILTISKNEQTTLSSIIQDAVCDYISKYNEDINTPLKNAIIQLARIHDKIYPDNRLSKK